MKRFYTLLLAAMATTLCATAQSTGTTYEAVDLGLSVKWATYNVGATSPEGYGNYYAWGETETKATYSLDTYKYGSDLTKYNSTDKLTTLEATDDAATANWGGKWRTPTSAEWQELIDNCTWNWTTLNGVKGYEVKATNGNTIFLPAAGYHYYDNLTNAGNYGRYWSSSLDTGNPHIAWRTYFYSGNTSGYNDYRFYGHSVRPVQDVTKYAVTITTPVNGTVEADKIKAAAGETVTLTITPATDYELDVLTVKDAVDNEIKVTDNKFTMPASAVTVSAIFTPTHTALETIETIDLRTENGSIIYDGEFQIFDLLGRNVTRMNGSLSGVYIVKVGEKAQKVVVK